jgi:YVTN family beta-propeller protein
VLAASLCAAAPAAAFPNAYVPLGGTHADDPHALAVFDVATGAKVTTIDLPAPAFQVAIDPGGTRAYVTTAAGVTVVDLRTNRVVTSVATFGTDVSVDPSGKRVYLADGGVARINVLDTATNTLRTPIALTSKPRAVVADASGTHAYTGNSVTAPYSAGIVDLTTGTQTSEVAAGFDRPENIGILPTGAKVYLANFGMNSGGTSVSVLDTATSMVSPPITVGTSPTNAVANPAGTRVYVANRDSMTLSVIDVASSTVVATIPLGFAGSDIAVAPDGRRAVVTGAHDDKVAFLDLLTGKLYSGPTDLVGAQGVAIQPAERPVAAVTVAPGAPGRPTAFDASGSSGGPVARYDWSFGDGSAAPAGAAKVTHVYGAAGSFRASLTVTNGCDPAAVFGPLGVSYAGQTAFCKGARTDSVTVPVTISTTPAARRAVAVVLTKKAHVGRGGVARIRIGCTGRLACTGAVSLRTARKLRVGKRPKARIALGSKRFKGLRAGGRRRVSVKLTRRGLRLLRSRGTLRTTATASARNPGGTLLRRSRAVKLSG